MAQVLLPALKLPADAEKSNKSKQLLKFLKVGSMFCCRLFLYPQLMIKNTLRYFDYIFYLRFAGLFFLLYYSYIFVVSVSAPTGVYFPFVAKYLNFPVPIRDAILHVSQAALSLIHYPSVLVDDSLRSPDGKYVLAMAWPCLGIGVTSFWLAFVVAHRMPIRQKVKWSLIGVVTIFIVNCTRVVIMMIAMVERWPISEYLGTNAHELFNYLSYAVLLLLVMVYYAKTGSSSKSSQKVLAKSRPTLHQAKGDSAGVFLS
ncbi:MAG: hypothetical protein EOO10_20595 [Chitinophagaceae bacterium]|nr:MAG: hypothetical protein EOO10_20595 [Chitinophagaceae bacterium]